MTEYRCASIPGATWFFTVNLAERKGNRLLVEEVDSLRKAFRSVQAVHAFRVDAAVVLPDHLHCIWTLPPGDSAFSTRWSMIRDHFPAPSGRVSEFHQAGSKGVNGDCGSGDFGSISSGMTTILRDMWITFTGPRSSMAGSSAWRNGFIQAFTPFYDAAFPQRLGGGGVIVLEAGE